MARFCRGYNTMWGKADYVVPIVPGTAYWVETSSHGGIIIDAHSELASVLSPAAWDVAVPYFGNWLCFEEDCAWAVAMNEIVGSGAPFQSEGYENDPATYMETVYATINRWYPEYAAAQL